MRNSGAKPISTRKLLVGEIQKAPVRLGYVQPAFPAARLRSYPALWQPPEWVATKSGSLCFPLLSPRAPGAQGCPTPTAWQLPGSSPAPQGQQVPSFGSHLGSRPAHLSRSGAAQASLTDGQQGGRLPMGPIPRQSRNLGSLGEHFVFWKKMYVGKLNTWKAGERIFSVLPALFDSRWGLPGCAGRVSLCKFWFCFAHKCSALHGRCHHSLAPCRVSLTSSTEKPYSIPAALCFGKINHT